MAGLLEPSSSNGGGELDVLDDPPRISSISAGEAHSLAVSAVDGVVYSFGLYPGGRLGLRKAAVDAAKFASGGREVPLPMAVELDVRVKTACAGEAYSFVIDEAGGLYAWGRNAEGQLGVGIGPNLRYKPQPHNNLR